MIKSGNKLTFIISLAVVFAVLAYISIQAALAQSTATIVGQVAVNGTPTDGVLVTCGPSSNTTFTYNGTPGYYFVGGLPYGTSLPFKATYQGYSYTDTVDPLPTGQQYYQIPTVSISVPTATVTPSAVPNATATPAPNTTVTPNPTPNATVTPAPNVTATPAPNSTITPTPGANASATITPVPPAPTAVPPGPTMPIVTPAPLVVTATPVATPIVEVSLSPTLEPTIIVTPTAVPPEPTQTKSPGFEGLLALSALLGAAYLVLRKGR